MITFRFIFFLFFVFSAWKFCHNVRTTHSSQLTYSCWALIRSISSSLYQSTILSFSIFSQFQTDNTPLNNCFVIFRIQELISTSVQINLKFEIQFKAVCSHLQFTPNILVHRNNAESKCKYSISRIHRADGFIFA